MDIKVNSNSAIVFDLDDTLYNEIEYLKSAYKEIAMTVDATHWLEIYSKMLSLYRSNINVFDVLLKEYDIPKKDLFEIYRNHLPKIQPFLGVHDFFEQIKNKNGFIGIITDGRKVTQTNKISALGIEKYVDHIVISEVIGSEKPHKNNFEAIQKAFYVEHYYYIADNLKKDFVSPKLLGWNTLALVDNGLNIHYDSYQYVTPPFTPDNYFLSYTELKVI